MKPVNVTLILNRVTRDLWIDVGGTHIGAVNDVTGVKRRHLDFRAVSILRRGERIGMTWEVEEIRERWSEER